MTASETIALVTLQLRYEHDVVLARQRARQIAGLLRFDAQDQVRIATAISELARNAFQYATGGRVEFEVARCATGRQALVVRVTDAGPGIADLTAVLSGAYDSPTGMGVGLVGARRMADAFDITSSPQGTRVELVKHLPAGHDEITPRDSVRIADALVQSSAGSAFEEVQQQNQELLHALGELRARQAEVERLNAELAETNRGVLALYAELDDRAEDLRRASDVKSRFLSDVGHELRTPLTSMINLSRILLDRADGPLTEEQEHQVRLIHRSAGSLTEMVNDLLDLAKIEAGKTTLRRVDTTAAEVLAALRGMFRPLVENVAVALVVEEPAEPIELHTDDVRLSQILRNFVSNAIKFTERGEVRVRAVVESGDLLRVDVIDTGIGIAPEDQARIFEEFTQVDSSVQRRVRGTGLGLPLARKLAHLLGGRVELSSALGSGSTFSLVVPRTLPEQGGESDAPNQPASVATTTGGPRG